MLLKYQDNNDEDKEKIINLEKEKESIEKDIKKLNKIILQASEYSSLLNTLKELEEEKMKIESSLAILNNKKQSIITEEQIKKYYSRVLIHEPKMLIKLFVDKIVLYNDSMDIYFATPLGKSPDDNQGFSFYKSKVLYESKNRFNTKKKDFDVNMKIAI